MPTFVVSLAVAASLQAGVFPALVVGLLGAGLVGAFAEARLARIISSIDRIARGDRYTSLPDLVGDGAIQQFAGTAETVRAALIEADTVSVDQLRRETEARLHHAGRLFFTGNFRRAVEEVVNAFTSAGERIRRTATELGQTNTQMARQVTHASEAAAQAAQDVAGVAAAARDVEALVMNSAQQVVEARAATKRTTSELARADATMRTLADAAQKIEQVIKLIQAIAGQTSLLALNATIEAARAGESGRGFAVVAGEVKELSRRTADATEEVSEHIHGIQQAVHDTAAAILAVDHSVAAMGGVNDNINTIIEQQIAQLGRIGSEAMKVAAEVNQTLPGIRAVVSDVATAGDAVLATAEDLIGRAESLAELGQPLFRRSRSRLDQSRHIAFAVRHAHRERAAAAAIARHDDREAEQARRPARPSGRGGDHGPALGRQCLCRADARAFGRPQSGGDLRLLDVGLAQARVAGPGRARRAACSIRANTKARNSRPT